MKKREKKSKRIKKEETKGLKIYAPDGKKLIFVLEPGYSLDYQELIGAKRRKSKYSHFKGSF